MSSMLDFSGINKGVAQKNYINTSDIFRNAKISLKFNEATVKDGKTTDPYLAVDFTVIKDGLEYVFSHREYQFPTSPDKVAYVGSKYEKGVKVGEYTKEEQIVQEQIKFGYFMLQVALAVGETSPTDFTANVLECNKLSPVLLDFQGVCKSFIKRYESKFDTAAVDFKTVFINNDNKKESNLRLSDASGANYALCKHDPSKPSLCAFTPYETQKNRIAKYTGAGAAPKSSGSIADEVMNTHGTTANEASAAALPNASATPPNEELF